MAHITGGRPAAEVTDRVNAVLSVAEARWFAISHTDDHGRKGVALCVSFGKMKGADGRPGVFVLLDNDQMQQNLRIASPDIQEAVSKHLAGTNGASADDIPSHLLGGIVDEPPTRKIRKTRTKTEG